MNLIEFTYGLFVEGVGEIVVVYDGSPAVGPKVFVSSALLCCLKCNPW